MPLAAGAELDYPERVEVGERDRACLVLDRRVVDARAAASDQQPRFAIGGGEPGAAEELEGGDAAGEQVARHGDHRQAAAAAAVFEDRVGGRGSRFGRFPAVT